MSLLSVTSGLTSEAHSRNLDQPSSHTTIYIVHMSRQGWCREKRMDGILLLYRRLETCANTKNIFSPLPLKMKFFFILIIVNPHLYISRIVDTTPSPPMLQRHAAICVALHTSQVIPQIEFHHSRTTLHVTLWRYMVLYIIHDTWWHVSNRNRVPSPGPKELLHLQSVVNSPC